MKIRRKCSILLLVLCFLLICVTPTYAYSSYDGALNEFNFADELAYDAYNFFNSTGYGSPVYEHYLDYTKASVQNEIGLVRCAYFDSHGTSDGQYLVTLESNGNYGYISSSEMYSWTRGFYKFVFLDTCNLGTTQWFNAFNMSSGDGLNHAYLGWVTPSYDDYKYYDFTYTVFNDLQQGYSFSGAVWDARVETGITNYGLFGSYSSTMYN